MNVEVHGEEIRERTPPVNLRLPLECDISRVFIVRAIVPVS
jgi:hypothetical protein